MLALALSLPAHLAPAPAAADEVDHVRAYRECMALVDRHPEEAFEEALAWQALGGGEAARHCGARARIGLKQYGQAATLLEDLAQSTRRGLGFKARFLAQAAQAWRLAGDDARALAVLDTALRLGEEAKGAGGEGEASGLDPAITADLLTDRASVLAAQGRLWDAVDDLNRVLERDPGAVDALVFRATAYRLLDGKDTPTLDLAAADLERALALDPDHVEGRLERGNLRRLRGDDAGARADWLGVLDRAPKSPAATAARANLEKLDVKTR
ncbi:MAG: hypothetical protein H6907_20705 [Hyphomicrobiales bacterium]|nr:hypothetical protein [Hyphomicrobiales bacterium]MCP5374163.1 hypothetical protein [Hyphomicrobiales bacterium]